MRFSPLTVPPACQGTDPLYFPWCI